MIIVKSTPRPNYILLLLTLGYILSLVDRNVLPMMVEPLKRDLGISDTQFATLHGLAFIVMYSLSIMPLGWLADRGSRTRIIAFGITLWSAMTSFSGMASTYGHLLIARMGVGIGEASLQPAAYSILADIFPRERLGKAIAIFSMGGVLGSGIAYGFGGYLLHLFGEGDVELPIFGTLHIWQLAFLCLGIPGLILAVAIALLPEPRRDRENKDRVAQTAGFRAFFVSRRPLLVYLCTGMALVVANLTVFITWLPAMLIRTHELSTGQAGVVFGLSHGFGSGLGFLAGGALADFWVRRGRADAHVIVSLVGAVALLPSVLATTLADTLPIATAGAFTLFFVAALPVPSTLAAIQIVTPAGLRAFTTSIFMIITNMLAIGVSPIIIALLTEQVFGQPEDLRYSLLVFGFVVAPIAALGYFLAWRPFTEAARLDGGNFGISDLNDVA